MDENGARAMPTHYKSVVCGGNGVRLDCGCFKCYDCAQTVPGDHRHVFTSTNANATNATVTGVQGTNLTWTGHFHG